MPLEPSTSYICNTELNGDSCIMQNRENIYLIVYIQ